MTTAQESKGKALFIPANVLPNTLPWDFRVNEKYLEDFKKFIAGIKAVIPDGTEANDKQIDTLAKSISKENKQLKAFVKEVFNAKTLIEAQWRDGWLAQADLLEQENSRLREGQKARKKQKLDEIRTLLETELAHRFELKNVEDKHRKNDVTSLVLLGSLTAGGKLSKTALDKLDMIVTGCFQHQQMLANRAFVIERECSKNKIDPPFTPEYLDAAFEGTDSEFTAKLAEIIDAELKRIEEEKIADAKKAEEVVPPVPELMPAPQVLPEPVVEAVVTQQPAVSVKLFVATTSELQDEINHNHELFQAVEQAPEKQTKLYLSVIQNDGSEWAVPVSIIARHRAAEYADEFDGDVERSLHEDTLPLFESDDYAIKDWAVNQMNWSYFNGHQVKVKDAREPDFRQAWLNGEKRLIELEV